MGSVAAHSPGPEKPVLKSLFQRSQEHKGKSPTLLSGPRVPRHSSSWSALKKHLETEQGLRVLDIGPTSPTNINYLTGLGHGVWMADLVNEALKSNWEIAPAEEGGEPGFNTREYFAQNLDFGGREFDVVLLWTTLDYVQDALIKPLIGRLHESMRPGGRILALFHTKTANVDTAFYRYHLTPTDQIEMQHTESFPVRRVYTNRNIEKLFSAFSNTRFFLAKDNLYEVIVTR